MRGFIMLILIGGACAGLLVATDWLTRDEIERERQARARLLAEALLGEPLPANLDPREDQFGRCPDWLFERHEVNGYAGSIEILALYREGALSLRVTRHRETPGIGDFIDHKRDPWITTFDNGAIDTWQNLDTVSGATITSTAIQRAATNLIDSLERTIQQQGAHCGS